MAFKSPEAAIRNALVTSASVSQLIGSRVFAVLAPADAALPFVTWRRAAVLRQQTLSGPMGAPIVTVVIDVFAETYEASREISDRCRQVLDGWGGTYENTVVSHVSLQNESDGYVTLAGGDLPPVYTVQQTYSLLWQES